MDPEPWPNFSREEFRDRLDRIVVSHKPDHAERKPKRKTPAASRKVPSEQGKTTGSLHNDTAYGFVKDRDRNIAPGKNGTWKVVSRAALASFFTPNDMDGALPAVRDHTSARGADRRSGTGPSKRSRLRRRLSPDDGKKRKKNPAALFAEHVANKGIQLNGRKVKVRRVRMVEELAVVPINDRRTGKPYKAYKPDGNAFADLYRLPTGRCTAVVIRRFDANQPAFDPAKHRPHPAAKKLMRLHIDDMVALEDAGRRRILRVVKMSGQTITLADHHRGGVLLETRNDDKDDLFKYLEKSANVLIGMGLRKVGVDEIGRLTDPGPRDRAERVMIGRVVEIASDRPHLALSRGFMTVSAEGAEVGRVPLDDIGVLLCHAHGLTYSNNLLLNCRAAVSTVVLCGPDHMPALGSGRWTDITSRRCACATSLRPTSR